MANLIGGAKNDSLTGTDDPDVIFGDPFTTGAASGGIPRGNDTFLGGAATVTTSNSSFLATPW